MKKLVAGLMSVGVLGLSVPAFASSSGPTLTPAQIQQTVSVLKKTQASLVAAGAADAATILILKRQGGTSLKLKLAVGVSAAADAAGLVTLKKALNCLENGGKSCTSGFHL